MYYPTGEITDYVYGILATVLLIIITIYFWKFRKNTNALTYTDKDYLRTLEIVELRYLMLSAEDSKTIEEVIEEKKKQP